MKTLNYQTIRLGDVADVRISGVDKKTIEGEIPVRLCNYTDVYYNWAIRLEKRECFMTASARSEEIKKFRLRKGQVALTKDSETKDDIGHPTYIAHDFDDVILGYHCALITPHEGKLDGQYLNAVFRTRHIADYLSRNAGGSGQRYYLSESAIRGVPLMLPSYDRQLRIAGLLGSIDEKIELNRRKIAELEALAKTIYDYWFVQFDFPDKDGRPYKSSGGKMVWNDQLKREVPEGWRVPFLERLCTISTRQCIPAKIKNLVLEHYSIPAYDDGVYPAFDRPESILSSKFIIPNGGILYSKLNAQFKRIWDPLHLTDIPIASSEFVVYVPNDLRNRGYIYAILNDEHFYKFANSISSSSTGSRKRFSPETTLRFPVLLPSEKILKTFSLHYSNILNRIKKARMEIESLKQVRVFLLPLLMNGQVSVGG